ncbi:MAG TPA: transporter substrate-binding domain-containing protein [Mesorhizobium sp.]|nr:transporter substrate-binding domain-containing protein [Mesorhizobium sp.]
MRSDRQDLSHKRRRRAALALGAGLVLAMASPFVSAQEGPAIPQLWESRERLPRPDISALPRLRFLTTVDFPPFNYLDADGRLVGLHVDLARAICDVLEAAARCEIQALPWEELAPALERGDGEAVIAGLAATADTRKTLGFSRPYLFFPGRFVTRTAEPLAEPLPRSLSGQRVGVVAGSAHESFLRDQFSTASAVTFPDQAQLLEALKRGEIRAAFGDGLQLAAWLGGPEAGGCCGFAGGPYLAPEYLGTGLRIAIRKEDETLRQALDHALHQIGTTNRFTELYLRYFPISFF